MLQRNSLADCLTVNKLKLCEHEVSMIKAQYSKRAEQPKDVDWERVDDLTRQIKFFAKFPQDVRITLLQDASYLFYSRGEHIFRQGDYGDLVYVILRGSCNILIKCSDGIGGERQKIINVLYDGDHFGELAMMGTSAKSKRLAATKPAGNPLNKAQPDDSSKQPSAAHTTLEESRKYFERTKRSASVQVAESVDLLCIPRDRFKNILLALIQQELDLKLKVLQSLPFFDKVEPFSLIPLANNLTSKLYKMGEPIIREGETPSEFCLIAKGSVRIVKEIVTTRLLEPAKFARARTPATKGFTFHQGNSNYQHCR